MRGGGGAMGSDNADLIATNMTASPSPFVVLPLSLSGKSPQGQKAPLVYEAQNVCAYVRTCLVRYVRVCTGVRWPDHKIRPKAC